MNLLPSQPQRIFSGQLTQHWQLPGSLALSGVVFLLSWGWLSMDWAFSGLDLDVEIHTAYGSCCQKPSLLVVSMPRSIQKIHPTDMRRCIIRRCAATDFRCLRCHCWHCSTALHRSGGSKTVPPDPFAAKTPWHGEVHPLFPWRGMVYGWFMDGLSIPFKPSR